MFDQADLNKLLIRLISGQPPKLTGVVNYSPPVLSAWLDSAPDPEARPGATHRSLLCIQDDDTVYDLLDRHVIIDALAAIGDDNDDGSTATGWEPQGAATMYFHATYGRRNNRGDGADRLAYRLVIPGTTIDAPTSWITVEGLHATGARGELALHLVLAFLAHTIDTAVPAPVPNMLTA